MGNSKNLDTISAAPDGSASKMQHAAYIIFTYFSE